MSNVFIPIDYLNDKELQLLDETKKRLRTADSMDELKYYEKVLQVLLEFSKERKTKG